MPLYAVILDDDGNVRGRMYLADPDAITQQAQYPDHLVVVHKDHPALTEPHKWSRKDGRLQRDERAKKPLPNERVRRALGISDRDE